MPTKGSKKQKQHSKAQRQRQTCEKSWLKEVSMDTMPDSRDSEYVMINGKRESMLGALTLMPEMNVADLAGDGLGNLIQLFEKRMMPDDPEGLEDFEAPFPNKLDCEDGAFVANLLNSGRLSARRPDEFVIIAAHE
ncbi:hypothetical protein MNEG_16038 [Monoraphidium neglectum]|uniref:Uncharacterized protein n=1 Tax=Monoraphidium neglectum TaxID=145388 RepID=A0A0D2M908_9CHLO|nr:hypothetical protein MNEG_16038 [Monoraphidium neglectum]KIY91925.1 hypothetical protein MNEG_16038 [Monoraphidium neglectum]|eukprot:XP_013890945.1 hypothetical protein MNEG_16038 [Monoraphidium neglectum]